MALDLSVPVCCKIRILDDKAKTLDLCSKIEQAGCSILTVHGRTKEQNKHKVGTCDWDIIKEIKSLAKIPIFSNGGIYKYQDVVDCLEYTGVDGVMSAEALLENPALFSGEVHDLDNLAMEYLELYEKYPGKQRWIKPHLFKFLHEGLRLNTDLRSELGQARSIEDHKKVVIELRNRRVDTPVEEKFGWYHRWRNFKPMTSQKKEAPKEDIDKIELGKREEPEK